jgi:hypothetical protein
VEFLSKVIPTLKNYALEVARVRSLDAGSAVVELRSEDSPMSTAFGAGFPEVLLVDFDARWRDRTARHLHQAAAGPSLTSRESAGRWSSSRAGHGETLRVARQSARARRLGGGAELEGTSIG